MSDYVNTSKGRPKKFYEGWLDHICQDGTWSRYWCVLRENVIYLFTNQRTDNRTSQEAAHVGTLTIASDSRLEKKEGDEKSGYRFDLQSLGRVNKFRTKKFTERELWKAYVEGLATGNVPNSIDLLPGQIQDIRASVKQFISEKHGQCRPPPPVPPKQRRSSETPPMKVKEGFDTPNSSTDGSFSDLVETLDNQNSYLEPTAPLSSCSASGTSSEMPFPPSQDIPCWLFINCSREMAEKILTVGAAFGNTLMRESTKWPGQFVISKKMEILSKQDFTHYKVDCQPEGYKIEVENPHEPMKTLAEVMDFFVSTSGKATTKPMICNDLNKLGIKDSTYHDYNTTIIKFNHDADSGEETVDAAPQLPVRRKTWATPRQNIIHAHTTRERSTRHPTSPMQALFYEPQQDYDVPEGTAPPPPPHTQRLEGRGINPVQPAPPAPHARFSHRSKSVPVIPPEELALLQKIRGPKLSLQHNDSDAPPLPPNHPSNRTRQQKPISPVPELPPNHPPPLKESQSESSFKFKRTPANQPPALKESHSDSSRWLKPEKSSLKHSESVGSGEAQAQRKGTSPHNMSITDDVAAMALKFSKQKQSSSMGGSETQVSKESKPEAVAQSDDGLLPGVASENFKKRLESIIPGGGPVLAPKSSNFEDEDPYNQVAEDEADTINHYQNSKVLKNMMK